MLYGIRRDLQTQLTNAGHMRRLGERPANVGFVLKGPFRVR